MGKRLDLAEKLVGQMLVEMGPRKFMIAVHNATAHGGALLEAPGIELDTNDWKLQTWHAVIDEMLSVSKWMEGDESLGAYFRSEWLEKAEPHGLKPRLADRLESTKRLRDYDRADWAPCPIAVVESTIFDITGKRMHLVYTDGNASNSVLLRGPLFAVVDHVRRALRDATDDKSLLAEIALIVADNHMELVYDGHAYSCAKVYGKRKAQNIEDDDDAPDAVWYTDADTLETLVYQQLGTMFHLASPYHGADYVKLPITEQALTEILQTFVRNQRNVGYVIATFNDRFNLDITCGEVNQRIVGGPGKKSRHPRIARRENAAKTSS